MPMPGPSPATRRRPRRRSTPTPSSWRCWPPPRAGPTPIPHYARIREHAPIVPLDAWAAGSSPASPTASRCCGRRTSARVRPGHHRPGCGIDRWGIPAEEIDDFLAFFERRQSMLTLNPPDHTRLRGLVARAFTPNTVEALRPHVVALCDGLLDTMAELGAGGESVDVMARARLPAARGRDRRAARGARAGPSPVPGSGARRHPPPRAGVDPRGPPGRRSRPG